MRRTIETLAAGCAVYVLMAACSSSGANHDDKPTASVDMTSGGHDGQGGQGGVANGAAGESAAGETGVMNPVAGASAQSGGAPGCECEPYVPPKPKVVEAECEVVAEGSSTVWAVAEFPGKTAEELAGLVAQLTYPPGLYDYPEGVSATMTTPVVGDGVAAVGCGVVSAPGGHAERVVFILR